MVYSCACNGEGGREVEGERREKGRWGREGVREREKEREREKRRRERDFTIKMFDRARLE